jgi:hypothetical protein
MGLHLLYGSALCFALVEMEKSSEFFFAILHGCLAV